MFHSVKGTGVWHVRALIIWNSMTPPERTTSFSSWSNFAMVGQEFILLLLRWIFGIFSNSYPSKWSRQNHFYLSLQNFCCHRMPFGLFNAPTTFQRCMLAIFSDFVEHIMGFSMDDFSVYGSTFDFCLENLTKVLHRCKEVNLVLNWEKCHFIVQEGVVLRHVVSQRGVGVDKAKVEVIECSPSPTCVKGVRSFLGHAGFYWRYIKEFSKPLRPSLCFRPKIPHSSFLISALRLFTGLKRLSLPLPLFNRPIGVFLSNYVRC